jgi:peptidoglycan hydrolase-like protein with peptidoglycan-binding domain
MNGPQSAIVSVARIWLDSRKSVRSFKGIICDDISEFESYMPSHAVSSLCSTPPPKKSRRVDGPGGNTPTHPGQIDGSFGQRTESAVRAYQTTQKITVDGVVGDQTWWVPAGAAGATLAKLAGLVTA